MFSARAQPIRSLSAITGAIGADGARSRTSACLGADEIVRKKNNPKEKTMEKELELGRYLDSDMIALTEDEVEGGISPTISWAVSVVSGYISSRTCPTTACTRAC